MIRKIDNIGVSVKDARKAKEFYIDKLGLTLARPYKDGDSDLLVQVGDSNLYIFQTARTDTKQTGRSTDYLQNDIGIDHLSFEVEDVDRLYQNMGTKGVKLLAAPAEDWGLRYASISDPDGIIIYLIKRLTK